MFSLWSNNKKQRTISRINFVYIEDDSYTYTGKPFEPNVIVVDVEGNRRFEGKDFNVEYKNNVNIGSGKIIVRATGNYSFYEELTFSIITPYVPAPSKISTSLYGYDDIKVSWSIVADADGYYVYYKKSSSSKWSGPKYTTSTSYKLSGLSDGAKYYVQVYSCFKDNLGKINRARSYRTSSGIYTLKKLNNPSVRKYSKNYIKISWNNISGESGYQIARSTKKSSGFKVIKSTNYKYKSTKIKTTRNRTYYYKVRAYKVVGKTKIYGPWSNVKSYKLK